MRAVCALFLTGTWAFAAEAAPGFNISLPDPTALIGAVAVDAAGNTYLTGSTGSSTFPTTPGVFQTQYGGGKCLSFLLFSEFPVPCTDAFVVKLDPAGAVVWATYLGGIFDDTGSAIAVDASGNVYVAGETSPGFGEIGSDNFPTTTDSAFPGPSPRNLEINIDAFVVKLSPDGSQMIYGTYLPGAAAGGNVSLAIDSSGNAYVAGSLYPAWFNFPTTAGAFQTSSNANSTGLIVKLNAAGSALVYATYLGGNGLSDATFPLSIAVDSSGSSYVTGYTNIAEDFPVTSGAFQTAASDASGFVTKMNADGSGLVYSTFLGTGGEGFAIKVDGQGRAYVLGSSADFPTTPGAFEPVGTPPPAWSPFPTGQFLASLSADGSSLVYGTYIVGATALDADASGDAYVAGNGRSGFPVSAGALAQCYSDNPFAAEFTPAGALAAATYFGQQYTTSLNGPLAVGQHGMVSVGLTGMAVDGLQGDFVSNFRIDNPLQHDGPCMSPMVQNAADYYSYRTTVAPGELITLQGVGIGPETGVSGSAGANGLLPANLAGVQVFFDEIPAPLQYVQAGQINAAVPWEIAGRASTQVQAIYNGMPLNSFPLEVQPAVPGLFYLGYPSRQAAILNSDGSINSASNPAHAGDVISLFGTGGGPAIPAGVTGGVWGPGSNTLLTLPVTVHIEDLNAPVVYAGAAPGLLSTFFQINVQVPTGLPPSSALGISIYFGAPGAPVGETVVEASVAVQ